MIPVRPAPKMRIATVLASTLMLGAAEVVAEVPAVPVELATVERLETAAEIWLPGTIISRQDALLGAEVPGQLKKVAETGERVRAGDPVATLEDWRLRLESEKAGAIVKQLTARLQHAELSLKRANQLSESRSTPQSLIDQSRMERDVLTHDLELARIEHRRASILLEKSRVLAPFDGVIAERFGDPGEQVQSGESIVRLVNITDQEVQVQIPLQLSSYVTAGQAVQIRGLRAGAVQNPVEGGVIRSVVPVGRERSRMLEIRVRPDQPGIVGSGVEVALPQESRESRILVPRDALVLREKAVYVFRVRDSRAERVAVHAGKGEGNRISVTGPLEDGDRVVVRGAERLSDGQLVTTIDSVLGSGENQRRTG